MSIYRNNLKNLDFGQGAPRRFDPERETVAPEARRERGSELRGKLTPPKTDSSGCFGIEPLEKLLRPSTPLAAALLRGALEGQLSMPATLPPDEWVGTPDSHSPIVAFGGHYYLRRHWEVEEAIWQWFSAASRAHQQEVIHLPRREHIINVDEDPALLPAQRRAIAHALSRQAAVIYGGPGTGKTYTASRLLAYAAQRQRGLRVIVAAPTGKAAHHLHQAILQKACCPELGSVASMTVHRLLHLYPDTIDAHFVLIDEASMLSAELLHKLIQIVGRSTQIAFFGDPDQLPPVDAPSLFREIAHTFGVKLETGLRAESTALIELAAAVREGNEKRAIELLDGSDKTVRRLSAAQILERIPLPTYERPPHPSEAWRLFSSYRVLLPLRRGAEGLDALHRNLFSTYAQRLTPGMWWSAPILIAKNAPAIDLFNGSPGLLIGLFDGTFLFEQAKAYFPDEGGGEMREIPLALLPPYEWGFCLSVHKSQGSEFAEVGAIFPSGSEAFGREGLYTAVTRAKKGVGIAIEDETLKALLKKRAQTGSGWSERVNSAGKVAD